ncbi:MAG TPA: type I DNA topoisomerase [Dehalococcoidia bacterium]|nr:type I DNA topoisomerase [Dehalococcoidia bacterium]
MAKKNLVIVESPAKARTLSKIMGTHYSIKASMGHVRDLPQKTLGVTLTDGVVPRYVVPQAKKAVVKEIKDAAAKAAAVYLATDPDREGEAISWHLVEAANLEDTPTHRVVFHEITEEAIKDAFKHPRSINMNLVNAQQARRVLDRLVGYKISPLLWKKVRSGLSAGRVQSVALRMIVEREDDIRKFVAQEYWTIEAQLSKTAHEKNPSTFTAKLAAVKGEKSKLEITKADEAQPLAERLKQATYSVSQVKKKRVTRQPSPPFITSTLQQEAWRKLHFTAQRTMAVAQQLYEGLSIGAEGQVGLITYMRTDSTRVAESALAETRRYIATKYGKEYMPPHPRFFTKKAKGAQEAHEAIRPTSIDREPASMKAHLTADQAKLYRLVWERMMASQMAAAQFDTTSVDIDAMPPAAGSTYVFKAAGSVPHFLGFLVLYSEGKDEANGNGEEAKSRLPSLTEGEKLKLLNITPEQHFTEPPPRYTEATLIKALEERGIGRPSTYAPIIGTIRQRGYVRTKEGRLHPEQLGETVNTVLVAHFPTIVDTNFTAHMEEELDEIAQGKQAWEKTIREFYTPFEATLQKASVEMVKMKEPDQPTDEVCPNCSLPMVIRMGRFGKFMACTGFPKCRTTKALAKSDEPGERSDRPFKGKYRRKGFRKKRKPSSEKRK